MPMTEKPAETARLIIDFISPHVKERSK